MLAITMIAMMMMMILGDCRRLRLRLGGVSATEGLDCALAIGVAGI